MGACTAQSSRANRNAKFAFVAILIAFVCYIVLYLPARPENRFSVPIYLLLSLGVVRGLVEIMRFIRKKHWRVVVLACLMSTMLLGSCAWLSSWIQDQALLCSAISVTDSGVNAAGCKDLTILREAR